MKKLLGKTGAKITAYFLLAFLVLGLGASVLGIIACTNMAVYSKDKADMKYEEFGRKVQNYASGAVHNLLIAKNADAAADVAENSGIALLLTDQDGDILLKTPSFEKYASSPYTYKYIYGINYRYQYVGFRRSVTENALPAGAGEFTAEIRLDDSFTQNHRLYWLNLLYDVLYAVRYVVYPIAAVLLALTVLLVVFLMSGAGRRSGTEELVPGYLHRVPFDILTAVIVLVDIACIFIVDEGLNYYDPVMQIGSVVFAVLFWTLSFMGWLSSLAMRVKLGILVKGSLIYKVLKLLWAVIGACFRILKSIGGFCLDLLRSIPLVWKTALAALLLCFFELAFIVFMYDEEVRVIFWFIMKLLTMPALLFTAVSLRRLQRSGRALASGDLGYVTDTSRMFWDFKKHGEDLNSIGHGMAKAVEERMKSERFKTELITNVSHDIKTPLTSIINYVDLLRTCDDPEKTAEYIEVLTRQSKRLKKLTEDLVEVSKAASGNMEAHIAPHSIPELLRQTVGEYEERLGRAELEPVLTLPEYDIIAAVDGTLMWRILDNLFSNACKYGQSGTRFYVDCSANQKTVQLTFRNISRERLNMPAEELMERFVRGDSARTGEGSGLGLSIALSLTELQGGTFGISVDGDLFKTELSFPRFTSGAPEEERISLSHGGII